MNNPPCAKTEATSPSDPSRPIRASPPRPLTAPPPPSTTRPHHRRNDRHGVCKTRAEAKAFVRHGRVTFEGEVVSRPEQKVVVRLYDGVAVDGKPVPVAPRALAEKETDEERE